MPDQKKLKRSFLSSEQTHAGMWTREATYQTRDNAKELATRAFPEIGKRPGAPGLQTTVNRIHVGTPVHISEIAMTDINPKDLNFVEGPNNIDRGGRRTEPPRAKPKALALVEVKAQARTALEHPVHIEDRMNGSWRTGYHRSVVSIERHNGKGTV